jgi:hypothetical protein
MAQEAKKKLASGDKKGENHREDSRCNHSEE